MIHLDTNLLIYLADREAAVHEWLEQEMRKKTRFLVSSIAWYEFLCGPTHPEKISQIRNLLHSPPISFDAELASQAAKYFNLTGRSRKRKTDTMIATTALLHGGTLATRNAEDFSSFESLGLELVKV